MATRTIHCYLTKDSYINKIEVFEGYNLKKTLLESELNGQDSIGYTFDSGEIITFLAYVNSKVARFNQWIYRLGSASSEPQYDMEDNMFTYSGDQDIWIRPEGASLYYNVTFYPDFTGINEFRIRNNGNPNSTEEVFRAPDTNTAFLEDYIGNTTFSIAELKENGEFVRWVYRLGSVSGTLLYSYNDIFTYDGKSGNIYIRAESKINAWTVSDKTATGIKEDFNAYFQLQPYQLQRYKITFLKSGLATFYTEGNGDTIGYLSSSTNYNDTNGIPSAILAQSDDSNNSNRNFNFTYKVTANTIYYLWIRAYEATDKFYTTLCVIPPGQRPEKFNWTDYYEQSTPTPGENFILKATAWTGLQDNINLVRKYKEIKEYEFLYEAEKGKPITAAMYNEVIDAIKGIGANIGTSLTKATALSTRITAKCLTSLVDVLNNIS